MTKLNKNVLLLSAGRRVELLQSFKKELQARAPGAMVFATDLRPSLSAACHVADGAFAVPRVTAEDYMSRLLEICVSNDIGLVVPTIDTELLGLAQARSKFSAEGIQIVISDEPLIQDCRDKRKTALLFEGLGIAAPKLMEKHDLTFPCFAKPYDGSRSVGAAMLASPSDLTEQMREDPKLMFMEYIDSTHDEYTVDAYFDQTGRLRCLVPRHRIEVRDGEINKGVTRKNHVYSYLRERMASIKGARGCLTLQLFANPEGSHYAALEINPRFGGGYPLSYAAGANYPGWLMDEYLFDRDIAFFDAWESNLLMLRYDAQVLAHDAA